MKMRKAFSPVIFTGLFIILLSPLTGCSGGVKASLGEKFVLHVGQTAQIEYEPLSITFNKVSADSRCPSNVTCVRAGEAVCDVTVTYKGSPFSVTLMQTGSTAQAMEPFQGYALVFSLEPYPVAGKQISPSDYRLNLTVNKMTSD